MEMNQRHGDKKDIETLREAIVELEMLDVVVSSFMGVMQVFVSSLREERG